MGLVLNRQADEFTFADLLRQLEIVLEGETGSVPIHMGGPVEMGRGFVLHTSEYQQGGTIKVNDDMLFEIIAVDNNSVDETYNVLLSVDDPRIIVKSLSDATDYSSTLKYAISQTSGENILVLEPDIASQLDNLPEVLEQISVQQSPVVFLSRTHKEEFANRFFTNILRILISMLFHIKVKDPFPLGFFCSGSLLRNMSKHDYRIDFRVALLAYMSRYNIRPIELPLSDYRQYGVIKSNLLLRMSQILRIPQISKVLVKIKKP